MTTPHKRTPGEALDARGPMADEDPQREDRELDRIDAMSDEELEHYLTSKGIDVKALDASAEDAENVFAASVWASQHEEEVQARVVRAHEVEAPTRIIPLWRAIVVWLIAAALVVVLVAGAAALAGLFARKVGRV